MAKPTNSELSFLQDFFAAKLDLGQRFCEMRAHKSLFNNLLRSAMKSKLTSNKADADPTAAEFLLS